MADRSLLNAGLLNMKQSQNMLAIVLLIQACLFLPISVAAEQNKALSMDEVLQNLITRQETLTTFIAEFQQFQENELFTEPQQSAGTLYFDRVGKLLMQMSQPEPYVVLLTNGKMITGSPGSDLRQKNLPGGKTFLQKILGMGRSVDQLKKQFQIQMSFKPDGYHYELEFKPFKTSRRMPYSEIQAEIDGLQWLPVRLHLVEPRGDSVRFTFQFTAINSPLPQGIFDIGPIDTPSTASDDTHENK